MQLSSEQKNCRIVLITIPEDAAAPLARRLVEARIAACVNIVPSIQSYYTWEGKLTEDRESLLIVKTLADNMQALADALDDGHPYEVPELLALEPTQGSQAYCHWLRKNCT